MGITGIEGIPSAPIKGAVIWGLVIITLVKFHHPIQRNLKAGISQFGKRGGKENALFFAAFAHCPFPSYGGNKL